MVSLIITPRLYSVFPMKASYTTKSQVGNQDILLWWHCLALSLEHWASCHGNKNSKRAFFFHVFTFLFPSPLISFGLTVQASVISPHQTHKTNPCYDDCAICFSFVIAELFFSKPRTNKHRKWETKRGELKNYFFLLYSSIYVLMNLYNLSFPLLFCSVFFCASIKSKRHKTWTKKKSKPNLKNHVKW